MSIPLRNFRNAMFAITTALVLAGCGGGGDGGSAAVSAAPGGGSSGGGSSGGGGGTGGGDSGGGFSGPGTLRFALTDAPACGFNEVNVTVERVRVHQSSTADDNDGGWFDIPVVNGPRKVNLLSLTNGVLMELGQTTLTAGHYSQIRLVLVSNKSKSMSNTVKPKGGVEIEMDTPSAAQSGLKLINGFTVAPGAMTDIVLDFDACKSVHRKGHGGYSLKPVLRTCPRSLTAIAGYVQMPTGLTGVTVSAQKNGVVMKATQPNASGQFVLSPLDPTKGPYDVVFTGTNLTTSVIALVPVAAGQTTTLNSILDPVKMPSSPSGTVVGTVGPAGAAATGSVRALQTVGTVPVVEVADVNVDPTTGDYSLFLPTAAPRLLIYSDPLVTPLNFQAQNASAGKYRLEASATGYQTQLGGEITVTFGSLLLDQDFTLVPVTAAAIAGYVQSGLTGVTVSAQKNGVIVKATQPNASGQFVLGSLDAMNGPYEVVFTGANLTTSVIASVPVAVGQTTTLGSSLDPVTMPTSTSGTRDWQRGARRRHCDRIGARAAGRRNGSCGRGGACERQPAQRRLFAVPADRGSALADLLESDGHAAELPGAERERRQVQARGVRHRLPDPARQRDHGHVWIDTAESELHADSVGLRRDRWLRATRTDGRDDQRAEERCCLEGDAAERERAVRPVPGCDERAI